MPKSDNTGRFLHIKEVLRIHPDWTDEQVAIICDLRGQRELDLIKTARKDLEAG